MAMFSKADLAKSKYITAIIGDIKAGNKIKVKGNKTYLFEQTDTINAIDKVLKDPKKYQKILYPSNTHAAVFISGDKAFRFIDIDKAPYSGMGASRNSLGKKLADAGELATVMSLTKDIKVPSDTGQKLFEDNPDAFLAWTPTFEHTRGAVAGIVNGQISSYDIVHDATDSSEFSKVITAFCKKIGTAKDSWNPADIFMIKNGKKTSVTKQLKCIVENYEIKDGLISMFNNKIYELYNDNIMYPISLKQLASDTPSIELNNVPGKVKVANYDIVIQNFNLDISGEGKEVGLFTFKNNDTGKNITMQVRGFPHGYTTAQTEITSDGSKTGGRLGKISTSIVDRIMSEYSDERISSITYFGRTPNLFGSFDERRMKEVYGWYNNVKKHTKVSNNNPITFDDFKELVESAKENTAVAENLCQKIQGLKMMNFFINNEANIANIMNKMINGAKKISTDNGFFVKIY